MIVASKCAKHETGIWHVQGKLENFFGSRGSFVFAINFGGAAQVVRSSSDRRAVKFFLFFVDGSPLGGRRELFCAASKKNYARRIDFAARNGLRSLGGRRAHFHRTFLVDGVFVRRILFYVARRPGSFRNQTKVLIGDFCHSEKNLRMVSCVQDKGGDNFDAKIFL